jgi:hypothetical protein
MTAGNKNYPPNISQAASTPMIAPTMLRLKANRIGGTSAGWPASVGENLSFMSGKTRKFAKSSHPGRALRGRD